MNLPVILSNSIKACVNRITSEPLLPQLLWLETTNHCNSHCQICQIWRNTEKEKPLPSFGTFQSPLFRKVKYILNSGGEPTLTDLGSLLTVEHTCFPKATLQISSNGILAEKLSDTVCMVLQQSNAKIDVGLSLDGIGDAHDEFRRVKGNFEKVNWLMRELTLLRKEYPNRLGLIFGSTLTEYTAKQTEMLLQYSRGWHVPFMWHWFNRSQFYNNETLKPERTEGFKEAILKVMPDSLYRKMWLDELEGEQPKFKCYALQSFCVLKRNGDIVPCLTMWNESIGNVYKTEPMKLWYGKKAKEVRDRISKCQGCLNSWGCGWSLSISYFPLLKYAVKKRLNY